MTSCTAAHAPQLLSHSDRGFLLPGSKVTVRWLSGEIALETEYVRSRRGINGLRNISKCRAPRDCKEFEPAGALRMYSLELQQAGKRTDSS